MFSQNKAAEKTNPRFDSLMQYIKKNTVIPEFLQKVLPDNPTLLALEEAIKKGDTEANCFSDPNCYLYLLYLIKHEKIPFWHGITVYTYVTGLMQLTNRQSLREEDADVKFQRDFKVDRLSINGKLTDEGERYLRMVCNAFQAEKFDVDYEELKKFILNLPPSEQWLFNIPYINHSKETGYDRQLSIEVDQTAYFIEIKESKEKSTAYMPSMSVINYLLSKMTGEPMKLMPCFGTINEDTLRKLHERGLHPLSLYAPGVKSNPKDQDGFRTGPLVMLVHDIAHAYWASRLSKPARDIIYQHYLPRLEMIIKDAKEQNDHEVVAILERAIEIANDYNEDLHRYLKNPETRFADYLRSTMGAACNFPSYMLPPAKPNKLGNQVQERIIYLLNKAYHQAPPSPLEDMIWKDNLLKVHRSYCEINHKELIEASIAAAQNAANNTEMVSADGDDKIQWQAWLDLIDKHKDGKTLWDAALKERHGELLSLITNNKLQFFPPYLPMTEMRREEFKSFVEHKLTLENPRFRSR